MAWNFVGETSGWLVDQTKLKSFRWDNRGHLKNLFLTSSPERKIQLTRNLVGSIRVTCWSKIAKIVPIRHPRWRQWWPSWKSMYGFFSWSERPIYSKPFRKHWVIGRSKIAKIVLIRNPIWSSWRPVWKSIFGFFSWTKRPIYSKLGRKHQDDW